MIVRKICEKYQCLPSDVETLTLDQVFLLIAKESDLERLAGLTTTTPQALQSQGIIPTTSGGSYVQRLRAHLRREKDLEGKRGRRARRRQRRQEVIEYKQRRGEL